jgi:hypothetical protein
MLLRGLWSLFDKREMGEAELETSEVGGIKKAAKDEGSKARD